jgi:hypothetical protein
MLSALRQRMIRRVSGGYEQMQTERVLNRRRVVGVVSVVALATAIAYLPVLGGLAGATTDSITTVGVSVYTVPAGVTSIQFELLGGDGYRNASGVSPNSRGGKVTATLAVTPGEKLQINVGGAGSNTAPVGSTTGGFNGGGAGGASNGGGGGGATDVRRGTCASTLPNPTCGPEARVLVAAGGGGASGGLGGDASGQIGGGGSVGGSGESSPSGGGGGGGASDVPGAGGDAGARPSGSSCMAASPGNAGSSTGVGGNGGLGGNGGCAGGGGGGGGFAGGGGGGGTSAGGYAGGGGAGSGFGPAGTVFRIRPTGAAPWLDPAHDGEANLTYTVDNTTTSSSSSTTSSSTTSSSTTSSSTTTTTSCTGRLNGTVYMGTPAKKQRFTGVTVSAAPSPSGPVLSVTTGRKGTYSLTAPCGTYTKTATVPTNSNRICHFGSSTGATSATATVTNGSTTTENVFCTKK